MEYCVGGVADSLGVENHVAVIDIAQLPLSLHREQTTVANSRGFLAAIPIFPQTKPTDLRFPRAPDP